MMVKKGKAIVIGSGVAGITSAIFLADGGYSVDVFEKNSAPGGRCSQLIKEGHRFDLGATMLLMPGIYKSVFKSLGLDFEETLPVRPLKDLYKIYFDDGRVFSFTIDKQVMEKQLEETEPGSYEKSLDYVRKGYAIFRLSMDRLINRNFYNVFQFITPVNIPLLIKIKAFIPHFSYARRFFRHPHLLMAYTFQNIYVGQSPFDSPALFSMVPAAELTEGSYFPIKGGMFAVVEKLMETAEKKGVRFHFGTPVRKIKINGKRAEGVLLDDNSMHYADVILANADLPYVYRALLPDKKASANLDRKRYSCSAICFHWGLDRIYPQLGHHSVFLSDGFRSGLDKIFREKSVSDTPSFYVHAPVRTDPSAAPDGDDTLSVIVASGHVDKSKETNWEELEKKARDYVITRLEKAGLENLREHIKFEVCYLPHDWEKACNISRGSVFGSLAHNIFQMGWFRPHNRHRKYKNLYFAGGSTHPGNGIPNVLISARLTCERIFKEN